MSGALALLALSALAVCALAVWPLWRSLQSALRHGALPQPKPGVDDALRAQWREWNREQAGRSDPPDAATEHQRDEWLRRLADEEAMAARATPARPRRGGEPPSGRQGLWALALVPALALLVYGITGDPQAVHRSAPDGLADRARQDTEALVARLSEALQREDAGAGDSAGNGDGKGDGKGTGKGAGDRTDNSGSTSGGSTDGGLASLMPGLQPGMPEAWVWLARLQADLRRFDAAEQAYARALALRPDVPQWLVDRADLYLVAHGASDGEAGRLIARALQLAPDHPKALAIAGGLAFDRGEAAQARRLWTRARALVPADSGFAQELDRSLAAAAAEGAAAPDPATAVSGSVRIAPALATRAAPQAAVFVVVRAAGQGSGPRMPLAVRRHSVAELPLQFTLDADDAMTANAGWAAGDALEVEVLISHTGEARAQAGDLVAGPVRVKAGAEAVGLVVEGVRR